MATERKASHFSIIDKASNSLGTPGIALDFLSVAAGHYIRPVTYLWRTSISDGVRLPADTVLLFNANNLSPASVAGASLFGPGMLLRRHKYCLEIPPAADVDNPTSAPKHCHANAIANGEVKAVVGYASYTRGDEEYVPAMIDVMIHESDGWLRSFLFLFHSYVMGCAKLTFGFGISSHPSWPCQPMFGAQLNEGRFRPPFDLFDSLEFKSRIEKP